jgi:energy-converting hydrogenase A subunit M
MTAFMYEKDLSAMKYAILTSTRHDRMIREIAAELDIPQIRLRKLMMDRFDMMLLENLPARYDQGKNSRKTENPVEKDLGAGLYTRAIPLISSSEMGKITEQVQTLIREGTSEHEAVVAGRKMIRGVILQ